MSRFAAHADGLWLDVDPDVPGVSGPPEAVRAIAAAWTAGRPAGPAAAWRKRCTAAADMRAVPVAADSEWGR